MLEAYFFPLKFLHRRAAVCLKRVIILQCFLCPIIFQTKYCWCIENHTSGAQLHQEALILWSLKRGYLLEEMPGLASFPCAARLWTWEIRLHTTTANGLYHKCSQPMMSTRPSHLLWCCLYWFHSARLMWLMLQQVDLKSIRNGLQWSSWDPITWGNKKVTQHPSRSRSMSGRFLQKSMELDQQHLQ